jgi:hypothetical protein
MSPRFSKARGPGAEGFPRIVFSWDRPDLASLFLIVHVFSLNVKKQAEIMRSEVFCSKLSKKSLVLLCYGPGPFSSLETVLLPALMWKQAC